MHSRSGRLLAHLVALVVFGSGRLCRAQTVIRDSQPPPAADTANRSPNPLVRTGYDSMGRSSRADSAPKPVAVPAPAQPAPAPPPPAPDPYPKGVCTADALGGEAPDLLMVTFLSRSQPADRQAALKTVNGTMVAADPDDPRIWYVRVQSNGNEFVLRSIADRLIRARSVSEVGPVQCPPRP
jgi:hypothetical protein